MMDPLDLDADRLPLDAYTGQDVVASVLATVRLSAPEADGRTLEVNLAPYISLIDRMLLRARQAGQAQGIDLACERLVARLMHACVERPAP